MILKNILDILDNYVLIKLFRGMFNLCLYLFINIVDCSTIFIIYWNNCANIISF